MYTDDISFDGDRSKQDKKSISSRSGKRIQPIEESDELITSSQILQLKYVEEILKHRFDLECVVKTPDNSYNLCGPGFILSIEEGLFIIYFEVDINVIWAAEVMKVICFVVDPTLIITGEEYYWDDYTNKLIFGDEAKEIKKDRDAAKKGYSKCPYCEKYYPINKINKEKGCCFVCEKFNVIDSVTYH